MHQRIVWAIALGLCCPIAAPNVVAATIETVPVGNPGNSPDQDYGAGQFGAVAYDYRIGKYEVTNDQYAEFLNAKAASDPLALYNANMGSDARGGITRTGAGTIPDPYVYTTKTDMGNKPVNYVSWHDAIRFANWLHNGQGTGDTETGAYTLLGGTPVPTNSSSIDRNAGALWFLPDNDEWHKAAYHQPSAQGGDSDDYWLYPTASNSAPTVAAANSTGDISNPGANVANYALGADWNGLDGNVTTVGSAGPLSDSFYGTADQGGNVMEWNESKVQPLIGTLRGLRGGRWSQSEAEARASNHVGDIVSRETGEIGFRVATVPEPGTAALVVVGCALMVWWRNRRK